MAGVGNIAVVFLKNLLEFKDGDRAPVLSSEHEDKWLNIVGVA